MIDHVLNRANARMTIFENDGDYEAFERVLEEAVDRTRTWLPASCVMPFVNEHKYIIGMIALALVVQTSGSGQLGHGHSARLVIGVAAVDDRDPLLRHLAGLERQRRLAAADGRRP